KIPIAVSTNRCLGAFWGIKYTEKTAEPLRDARESSTNLAGDIYLSKEPGRIDRAVSCVLPIYMHDHAEPDAKGTRIRAKGDSDPREKGQ
ncbi:MAG: hypothetical protein DRQ45_05485, partial [Gammaproteobacteria bacterium]